MEVYQVPGLNLGSGQRRGQRVSRSPVRMPSPHYLTGVKHWEGEAAAWESKPSIQKPDSLYWRSVLEGPTLVLHQQWWNIPSERSPVAAHATLCLSCPGILLLGSCWLKDQGALQWDHHLSRLADLVEMFVIKLIIYRHFSPKINCIWGSISKHKHGQLPWTQA